MPDSYLVQVNGEPAVEIDAGSSRSLLENLERAGKQLDYHCRSGFCGACRSTLLSGQVEYTTEPLAYLRPKEILPCICIAKSDLKIEQ